MAVKAYKTKGFHTPLQGSITGCLLTLAAVLFVDDTVLFLRADDGQSEEEFIRKIQSTVTFWGMVALATGGYLKQKKCQVALTLFNL